MTKNTPRNPNTAIRDALLTVLPEAAERIPVTHLVRSPEELCSLTDEQLLVLSGQHEQEMVRLRGRLDIHTTGERHRRGVQALRTLELHGRWIDRELARRRRARASSDLRAMSNARIASAKATRELQQAALAARAERQARADADTLRWLAAFKAVVREQVGDELYGQLCDRACARSETSEQQRGSGRG